MHLGINIYQKVNISITSSTQKTKQKQNLKNPREHAENTRVSFNVLGYL